MIDKGKIKEYNLSPEFEEFISKNTDVLEYIFHQTENFKETPSYSRVEVRFEDKIDQLEKLVECGLLLKDLGAGNKIGLTFYDNSGEIILCTCTVLRWVQMRKNKVGPCA